MNNKTRILVIAAASLVGAILVSVLLIGMISGNWPWTAKNFGEYVGLKPKETTAATETEEEDPYVTTTGEGDSTQNTTGSGTETGTGEGDSTQNTTGEGGSTNPSVGVEVEPGDVVVPITPGGSGGSGGSSGGVVGGGAPNGNIDFDAVLGAAGK